MKVEVGDILCVIVLFNKTIRESIAFNSLKSQGVDFLIVDNSPEVEDQHEVRQIENVVAYLHFADNPGVSHAYNVAADYARKNGYRWLLLSDQDTEFNTYLISSYLNALKANQDIKLFCPTVRISNNEYLSPVRCRHYFSHLSDERHTGLLNPRKFAIINSGLLIELDAFFNAGGYNDKVFLDFSDFQFLERFGAKYDKIVCVGCDCYQSFSNLDDSNSQLLKRYKLFCQSLKHYIPLNPLNKFWIFCIAVKRCVGLCFRLKKFSPVSAFFSNYC